MACTALVPLPLITDQESPALARPHAPAGCRCAPACALRPACGTGPSLTCMPFIARPLRGHRGRQGHRGRRRPPLPPAPCLLPPAPLTALALAHRRPWNVRWAHNLSTSARSRKPEHAEHWAAGRVARVGRRPGRATPRGPPCTLACNLAVPAAWQCPALTDALLHRLASAIERLLSASWLSDSPQSGSRVRCCIGCWMTRFHTTATTAADRIAKLSYRGNN